MIYWRGGDYAGIGPGAHGRLTLNGARFGTETLLQPQAWLDAIAKTGSGESIRVEISALERAEEYLMMSLRLAEGTDLKRFEALSGTPLNEAKLGELAELGFVDVGSTHLAATPKGRPVLNGILRELLA